MVHRCGLDAHVRALGRHTCTGTKKFSGPRVWILNTASRKFLACSLQEVHSAGSTLLHPDDDDDNNKQRQQYINNIILMHIIIK
jgi:hypothetical protein